MYYSRKFCDSFIEDHCITHYPVPLASYTNSKFPFGCTDTKQILIKSLHLLIIRQNSKLEWKELLVVGLWSLLNINSNISYFEYLNNNSRFFAFISMLLICLLFSHNLHKQILDHN